MRDLTALSSGEGSAMSPPSKGEDTEAQRGKGTCPGSKWHSGSSSLGSETMPRATRPQQVTKWRVECQYPRWVGPGWSGCARSSREQTL